MAFPAPAVPVYGERIAGTAARDSRFGAPAHSMG